MPAWNPLVVPMLVFPCVYPIKWPPYPKFDFVVVSGSQCAKTVQYRASKIGTLSKL